MPSSRIASLHRRVAVLAWVALAAAGCNNSVGSRAPTAFLTHDPATTGTGPAIATAIPGAAGVTPGVAPGPKLGEATTTAPAWTGFVETPDSNFVAADQFLVMLVDGAPRASAEEAARAVDGKLVGHIEYLNLWKIQAAPSPTYDDWQLRSIAIGESPDVVDVAPVSLVHTASKPTCAASLSDPVYAGNHADPYRVIGVSGAWDAYYSSGLAHHPVHIGLIDTELTEDPTGKVPWEFNQVTYAGPPTVTDEPRAPSEDDPSTDGFHHADGVLGIIAADPTNGGISGIASPLGKSLIVSHSELNGGVLDFPDDTSYTDEEMINTVKQIEAGATIINGSWAAYQATDDNAAEAQIWQVFFEKMAKEHPDVLFVYAAGNDNTALNGKNDWPGGIKAPNVITVGNESTGKVKDQTSNYVVPGANAEVTLAAPGDEAVWGLGADGAIRAKGGGTSSAAPMVTATAALIRSIDPTLTAAQIKDIIASTASQGPAQLGGKSLLVDAAVRKTIDGVRKRAGVAPLTDQAIADGRALCQISVQTSIVRRLQAPAGSSTWNVAASLAVVPKSTYVTLAVDGRGPAQGEALTAPGSAAWTVTVPKDGAVVVVSRTDNDYWVALRLLDMGQQEPPPATEPPAPQTLAPTSSASPLCSDTDPYWDPVGGLMCPTEVPKVGG